MVGVNLPWLQYGCDFGGSAWQPGGVSRPEQRARLRRVCTRLAGRGLTVVRWFLLCDGRAGIRFDTPATARGLDDGFWRDLDAGVEEAARAGLTLVPVLFDYLFCRRARVVDGVRCGGHRGALASDGHCGALLDRVVVPILRRCAGEPAIRAWDIINEPEWITLGRGSVNPFGSVTGRAMRRFLAGAAEAIHAETRQWATVGLASWRGLPLVKDAGLDVYQVHWYDRRERMAPLGRAVGPLAGGPAWLGEFPTAASARSPGEILRIAREAGYSAAFAWSAEAVDRYSNLDAAVLVEG